LIEKIDTLIVGGGQAGIAMSEHLSICKIPHLVLERNRIAERWRSERWDSLVANGPAWHDRFPNMEFADFDPNGYPSKEQVVDYFVAYAEMIKAPIRCGVEVKEVRRNNGRPGFRVETSDGIIDANNVVAATGPFQCPLIPKFEFEKNKIMQIHSSQYQNPGQLPDGGVLVVGAGSSGAQIADELLRSGKSVYLSVGPHDLPPRSYRGRDFVWWLGVLGKWEAVTKDPGTEHITIAVSGAHGGQTVDFRGLAERGISLLGRTQSFKNNVMYFAPDLTKNIAGGNAYTLSLLDQADNYVIRNGLNFPLEPEAREVLPDPECVTNPILEIDLKEAKINSIVWATGFDVDFSWLKVDALDENGRPKHERGISTESGIYFLGLPWQSRRGSSFIWGVWQDAKFLADQIKLRTNYLDFNTSIRASKR
jgi:putative flavoprotein involved in K+ transport|tara:strand:+ start:144 stop:1409 length:1266 start_codon:yes stop_codon:yes gene_type:complete